METFPFPALALHVWTGLKRSYWTVNSSGIQNFTFSLGVDMLPGILAMTPWLTIPLSVRCRRTRLAAVTSGTLTRPRTTMWLEHFSSVNGSWEERMTLKQIDPMNRWLHRQPTVNCILYCSSNWKFNLTGPHELVEASISKTCRMQFQNVFFVYQRKASGISGAFTLPCSSESKVLRSSSAVQGKHLDSWKDG